LAKAKKIDLLTQELARVLAQFRRLNPPRGAFHGFKSGEFILLATLIDSIPPGANGLKASELSNRLQVTPAAVTHLINDLEKAGQVERVSDPADRRFVLLRPTAAGLQLMQVANVQFLEILKGLIEFLGEDDSREFIRLMSSAMTYFKNKMDALKEQEE
jgi:DNA-binding MarR family transcriptional regulator